MPQLYTNDATSTLLAGITDVATSLSVVVADAGKFPAITAPDFFDITVKEAGAIEVMRITARAAEVMTIGSRAREGTTAKAFTTTASVILGLTAANASTVTLHADVAVGAHAASAISNVAAGAIAATTVQAAINELDSEKLSNAAGAVLTANLADLNVTSGKIADLNITTAKIADLAVTTVKIADAAVTYAKLQDVTATDRLLGRVTAGAGDAEEIVCTPFARTLLDDANQAVALTTLGAPLNATVALTAAYTVVAADRGKLFDCSGTFTVTLTAAATLGAGFSFAVRNSGTGVITLDPDLAELVDGAATITYAAGVSSLVTCNGTAFNTVGLIKTNGGTIVSGVSVATTSGTSIDFTGIPSWVKRITVMFDGVSTTGTSAVQIQIGAGAVDVASTYFGAAQNIDSTSISNSNAFTTGFRVQGVTDASLTARGISTMVLRGSNTWCFSSLLARVDAPLQFISSGAKAISGTLDRIRLTTVNGTDTFDAGSINILYE